MHRILCPTVLATILLALTPAVPARAATKLLRFPDIHGDQVVFTYAGDLWSVPVAGGTATRLTAHPGVELFAKFSPDGRWIAFTGQYDGDEQVYIIPATGGVPRQLTYYPARGPLPPRWGWDNQVYGWSPDGKRILFRSLRDGWELGDTHLYTVSVDGGLPVELPMPQAGAGDFSPDGSQLAYSPLFRDFRTWKHYQGGWAQDLWIFDLANRTARRITEDPRTDRDPMWIGDTIYFDSDRDGKLNLYAYDTTADAIRQLTHETTWDVRWPSADESGRIVYELDGELHVYDTRSAEDTAISIDVPSDELWARPGEISVADDVEDFELSPDGKRALFVARGDVFTVPIEKGPTRNLTHSSNAHDKWARWSPDGKWIAYVSDASGEDEVYRIAQDGSGTPERLTHDGKVFRYAPEWSPDGSRLAFSDKNGDLWVVTVAGGKTEKVAHDLQGRLTDFSWSPHGGFLATALSEPAGNRAIWIWSVDDGKLRRVTSAMFDAGSPAWDPKGRYLYYVSTHEFQPAIGSEEFNYVLDRENGIFAVALRKDVPDPFPPESDEVGSKADANQGEEGAGKGDEEAGGKQKRGKEEKSAAPAPHLAIDWDGLGQRVARVPIDDDNIPGLVATQKALLYIKTGAFYYGRETRPPSTLYYFSLDERKESTIADDISGVAVSRDGEKVLVEQHGHYNLYDAGPKAEDSKKTVSTKDLKTWRVPREEWAEIFDEVWRRYRDFFYVPNMNGYDWKAIGDRYRALLPEVGHRSDLNYLLGEMIAELNNSHAYIVGGDFEIPQRPHVALPGARFELDDAAGRYRLARIFPGENEEPNYRSPLTEIGVDAHQGDYVLAIDGEPLAAADNPYRLLRFKDRPVELTLNDKPTMDGARKVSYRPIDGESDLVYLAWVQANRRRVDEMTGGRIGYLHIPDMGADGIREFIKWFYPQIRKEGLIVDVRSNGGGNVSQMLIERLSRKLLATGFSRNSDLTGTYPGTLFHGPMVALINETSASDGDIFPAMFRQAGLGPLIGKRTWGGVTGITGHGPLIDGGTVFVPEFGFASAEGRWIIEGHGVDPDIEVDNDPESVLAGHDPQLERGIAEVLKRLDEVPHTLPSRPAPPVRAEEPSPPAHGAASGGRHPARRPAP